MPIMPFEVVTTEIADLHLITTKQITDERGTVRGYYRASAFEEAGIAPLAPWRQVNLTETKRGAIRGMHGEDVRKLIGVASGNAFGAYVDARLDSPTTGKVVTVELEVGTQLLVPPGVCNGFQALADGTQYLYCFDAEWVPEMKGVAVNPLDPELGIAWPIEIDPEDRSLLSAKDAALPSLADVLAR